MTTCSVHVEVGVVRDVSGRLGLRYGCVHIGLKNLIEPLLRSTAALEPSNGPVTTSARETNHVLDVVELLFAAQDLRKSLGRPGLTDRSS